MDDTLTSNQRMADALLRRSGSTLVDFLAAHRGNGDGYETISKELFTATNGAVKVSYQTVKRWLIDFGLLDEAAS